LSQVGAIVVKILITAGPTYEPIDAVRFIGNRSSGLLGQALCAAAVSAGHYVTAIFGPVHLTVPTSVHRIDIETAEQMQTAVLSKFPDHDLLIMAAAVADFRPLHVTRDKLARAGKLVIECEATSDILAAVSRTKRPNQRTIGFSLETQGNISRSQEKLVNKQLDLIVYNPLVTLNSMSIDAVLIWPDGKQEALSGRSKKDFATALIDRAVAMWPKT
jgi:phosphopantothenoylcysteine decarboxylase/phosphopantothenate--cysteine ligase